MQILKGSKERQGEQNIYTYSKGSSYQDVDLDKESRFHETCLRVANSNDYSEATTELERGRTERVERFISTYPPHYAVVAYPQLLLSEDAKTTWNVEALEIFIRNESSWSDNWERLIWDMNREILFAYGVDTKGMCGPDIREAANNLLQEIQNNLGSEE